MQLEWKASELPKNAIISTYDIDHNCDILWLKDVQGDWWIPIKETRATRECIYDYEEDVFFKVGFFKIVSLPPEWYDQVCGVVLRRAV